MVPRTGNGRGADGRGALPASGACACGGDPGEPDAERFSDGSAAGRDLHLPPAGSASGGAASRNAPARRHSGPRKPRHDPADGGRAGGAGCAAGRLRGRLQSKNCPRDHGRGLSYAAGAHDARGGCAELPRGGNSAAGDGHERRRGRSAEKEPVRLRSRDRQRGPRRERGAFRGGGRKDHHSDEPALRVAERGGRRDHRFMADEML